MDIIKSIEHEQLKNKIPDLKIGDTIKVHVRVKEGTRERIQVFEGIIIKKQGGGVNETFTVRRISYGVGVEKTFLIHSPTVEKVEVIRVGKARRAKLFYLRDRLGKAAKTKEKIGARIETKEITVKELAVPETEAEVVEEEVLQEAVVAEQELQKAEAAETVVEETPVAKVEEVKETVVEEVAEVTETPVAEEVVPEVKEEPVAVEEVAAPEEAPAVETETVVTEE